ncbi:ABC-2 transporter permease [Spirochaeta cellobiosiphila]|uniref:ABC-2 transporter permease n=1 Tax=Spirochaeta cellobiosiphila TaxID=504483 RepID=UPI0004198A34|nr:ABC-2 transporter permease [Spirochaeta cellobiosiphila]
MKSLLIKDFYSLRRQTLAIVTLLLFLLGIVIFLDKDPGSYTIIATLMSTLMISGVFVQEERMQWLSFALTMPIERRDYIRGKYILILILAGGGCLWGNLLVLFTGHIQGALWMSLVALCMAIGIGSGIIPLTLLWGSDYSRYIIILSSLTFIGLTLGIISPYYFLSSAAQDIKVTRALLFSPLWTIVFSLVCYKFSVHIFKNKEI